MPNRTLVEAINDALGVALAEDERVLVLGEDVGRNGGVFRATDGLIDRFGADRVVDTPLAEAGIIGTSIGLAEYGMRPVAEIQFLGFTYQACAQLMAQAADDLRVPNPSALYPRFLGWALGRNEVCRVCGKANHTVVAGLPPRLFPCDALWQVMDRQEAP